MKLQLQPNQMRGRVVKVASSKSGIVLPGSGPQKKETILFIIDEMGHAVVHPLCQVGKIIIPMGVNNMVLRDKTIYYITEDLVVMAADPSEPDSDGDDISLDQLEIEGVPFKEAQQRFLQAHGAA